MVTGDAIDTLRRTADPSKNVAAPDDDGDLHPRLLNVDDLIGNVRQNVRLDAVTPSAHERFAGEFKEDAFVARGGHVVRFISEVRRQKSEVHFSIEEGLD